MSPVDHGLKSRYIEIHDCTTNPRPKTAKPLQSRHKRIAPKEVIKIDVNTHPS